MKFFAKLTQFRNSKWAWVDQGHIEWFSYFLVYYFCFNQVFYLWWRIAEQVFRKNPKSKAGFHFFPPTYSLESSLVILWRLILRTLYLSTISYILLEIKYLVIELLYNSLLLFFSIFYFLLCLMVFSSCFFSVIRSLYYSFVSLSVSVFTDVFSLSPSFPFSLFLPFSTSLWQCVDGVFFSPSFYIFNMRACTCNITYEVLTW